MMRQAIASDDPVVFFEPKRRYWDKGEVDPDEALEAVPLHRARVAQPGTDVTVAAYGPMVATALEAAGWPRRRAPPSKCWTCARCRRSTSKRSRRRCVRPAGSSSPTRHPSSAASAPRSPPAFRSAASTHLEAPVRRVGGFATPYPPSKLESHFLPDADRILHEVDRCLDERRERRARRFLLPDLGEGLTEAEVVAWHVAAGRQVTLNQVLVEVETEKAVVELPSPFAGTVVELLAQSGDTVAVGSPLVTIDSGEGPRAGVAREAAARPRRCRSSSATAPAASRAGTEPAPAAAVAGAHRAARRPRHPRARTRDSGRPLAAPPVRYTARQAGVDLARWPATGPTASSPARTWPLTWSRSAPGREPGARGPVRPVRGVQKHMAEAMVRSVREAPQACVFLTVDVTRVGGAGAAAARPIATSRGCADAAGPGGHGPWSSPSSASPHSTPRGTRRRGEVVTKHYVNLGVAVAGPHGLVVPNVKDAQDLSLRDLVRALDTLTTTPGPPARPPPTCSGGTITLTNVGVFGVDAGVPILNPGEAAIVAMGAVQRRPWEYEGAVALREVVTLSVAFDHRLVDGQARLALPPRGGRDPGRPDQPGRARADHRGSLAWPAVPGAPGAACAAGARSPGARGPAAWPPPGRARGHRGAAWPASGAATPARSAAPSRLRTYVRPGAWARATAGR